MRHTIRTRSASSNGMTLVELSVVVAIFAIIMVTLHSTLFATMRGVTAVSTAQALENYAREAMDQMKTELSLAAIKKHPVNDIYSYPYRWSLTSDGQPFPAQGPFTTLAAQFSAILPDQTVGSQYMVDDPADGVSDALVFVIPICDKTLAADLKINDPVSGKQMPMQWSQDAQGNWFPEICWGGRANIEDMYDDVSQDWEIVYYLRSDPINDGNILERRVWNRNSNSWAGQPREICRFVERLVFEPQEPNADSIRASIYMRKRDDAGRYLAADASMNILMRSATEGDD